MPDNQPGRFRRIIYEHVVKFVRDFLRDVRVIATEEVNESKSATRFTTGVKFQTSRPRRDRGELIAVGRFHPLGLTPFDEVIEVPPDGIKPVKAKALRLEKPEGIVFRSRTYTKFAGQTIQRPGFLDEALRKSFQGLGGDRSVRGFLRGFSRAITIGLALSFAARLRSAGHRVTIVFRR